MSIEKIKTVSDQILNRLPAVRGKSEEATKQALVLPMLDALGYDIWNPSEVCPEYEADFAIKKAGQKEKGIRSTNHVVDCAVAGFFFLRNGFLASGVTFSDSAEGVFFQHRYNLWFC